MHRVIEHTGFARRSFDDIVHIVERDALGVFGPATEAASARSVHLVLAGDPELDGFDSSEILRIVVEDTQSHRDQHLSVDLSWTADRRKRLLANVDARLDIHPLVRGPRPSTELVLRGQYHPLGEGHSPETILFGRRVVKAALLHFLQEVIRGFEDYEEAFVGGGPPPGRTTS